MKYQIAHVKITNMKLNMYAMNVVTCVQHVQLKMTVYHVMILLKKITEHMMLNIRDVLV